MKEEKKYKVATLGCRTNQYESQAYVGQLEAMGYREAGEGEVADVCIVNTCTVTEGADRRSRYQIRQMAGRVSEGGKLVVTGCLAERKGEEVGRIAGVTDVVPNREKEELLRVVVGEGELPEFKIDRFAAHTRAFVKVQDGCDSFCTYCILPYVRGRSRSRKVGEVVEEVKGLVRNGYKEVVLTGINVGDYEGEKGEGLADLVKAVDEVEGLERLRISSIDPDEVDEHLMEAVLGGKRTCPSLHIVLQSGSNVILKRMNRKYTKQVFLESVDRLKKACPRFTFTTDVIVGFPGETEADFEETVDVIREVQFADVHMFPYSVRERTRAALYPGRVGKEEMDRRRSVVLREKEQQAFRLREGYVGEVVDVLVEGTDGFGHSENFLPVEVRGSVERNEMVRVRCVENRAEGLVGEVV